MATRATITLENFNTCKLYKHWDGYPSATLPWLESFNKKFTGARGVDNEYKFAQLIRSSAKDAKEFDLDDNITTGWGVVPISADMDAEFEYRLMLDGTVTYKEL